MAITFANDPLSPIHWVASTSSGTNKKYIKSPSKYQYDLQDVSRSDAGRMEDAIMHKYRVGQVCKVSMEWQNVTTDVVSALLQAFDPEYLYAEYLDAKTGTYRVGYFYVGNRSTPLYSTTNGVWENVSFNLERVDGGSLINANNN